ncbi:MAG TPA: polysaccharide deacetylase family protein [Thermomicrobiaceae bacterium]|nr:polysaccharide deacetylase family protein [Thermomicrobiaceae bacterium]
MALAGERPRYWPRLGFVVSVLLGLCAGLLAWQPGAAAAAPNTVYFPETGHTVADPFLTYWRTHGALPIFGYPITQPIDDQGMTVQYFERARFELHKEFSGSSSEVELTLLGRQLVGDRHDGPFKPFPANTLAVNTSDRTFFPQTGHYLAYGFKQFWEQNGGLAVFGYPLSEDMSENGLTVQYFQRARFEWHPELRGTPYEVELGRLGADAAANSGVKTSPVGKPANVPDYAPALFTQSIRLPILMYHQIGPTASRYVVPVWLLNQQLDWLQSNGYTPVTLTQLYNYIDGTGALPAKAVVLTFDDGTAGQWAAVQALAAHHMTGVFFIPSGTKALTDGQLRQMVADGMEIESHSITHPYLTKLSGGALENEVAGSRAALQKITGQPVDFFAYPYGDFNGRVIAAVQAAGYRGGLAAWGGAEITPGKRWQEPRIEVDGTDSMTEFAYKVITFP